MDVSIGIGRTIMEHVGLSSFRGFSNQMIESVLLPLLNHLRFFFYKIGPHRKSGLGQV